jgi:hypothetical protein
MSLKGFFPFLFTRTLILVAIAALYSTCTRREVE